MYKYIHIHTTVQIEYLFGLWTGRRRSPSESSGGRQTIVSQIELMLPSILGRQERMPGLLRRSFSGSLIDLNCLRSSCRQEPDVKQKLLKLFGKLRQWSDCGVIDWFCFLFWEGRRDRPSCCRGPFDLRFNFCCSKTPTHCSRPPRRKPPNLKLCRKLRLWSAHGLIDWIHLFWEGGRECPSCCRGPRLRSYGSFMRSMFFATSPQEKAKREADALQQAQAVVKPCSHRLSWCVLWRQTRTPELLQRSFSGSVHPRLYIVCVLHAGRGRRWSKSFSESSGRGQIISQSQNWIVYI